MHAHLSESSARCCHLRFGDELFVSQGMVFGLTISPYKFQMLNNVLVSELVRHGYYCLLYLDDRMMYTHLPRPLVDSETSVGTYALLCGLNMLGGFISLDKSSLVPSQCLEFLGFIICTLTKTIRVPKKKHDEFCELVKSFMTNPFGFDYKTLESIRGKCISWLLVISNAKLFIREMNLVIATAVAEGWSFIPKSFLDQTKLFEELEFWTQLKEEDLVRYGRRD